MRGEAPPSSPLSWGAAQKFESVNGPINGRMKEEKAALSKE